MGMIPAFAVMGNDIYQHDHVVSSPKVCGDQLCQNTTSIFGNGGPHFQFNIHAAIPQNITSYHVTIILPNSTFPHIDKIISKDNFTSLQNNIATMAVVNIYPTNAQPSSNYCPIAKEILLGQDGYLGLIYNQTTNKDMTSFVYPPYCYIETGKNPINGQGLIPSPEFPGILFLIMGISVMSVIAVTALHRKTS